MKADNEQITDAAAVARGQQFGWSKIISAGESMKEFRKPVVQWSQKENKYVLQTKGLVDTILKKQSILGDLGQGIHALQDAIAHKGVNFGHHNIYNDMHPSSDDILNP